MDTTNPTTQSNPTDNITPPISTPSVSPQTASSPNIPSKPKIDPKLLYGGFAIVVIILIIIGISLSTSRQSNGTQQSNNNQSNIPSSDYINNDQIIGQVGDKKIIGSDFNSYLNKYYPTYWDQDKSTIEEIASQVKNSLASNAAIVLAAKDENIITDSELTSYFSDPSGTKANDIISKVNTFIDNNSAKMDYYIISIWYYNMYEPEIPLAQAETIALSKITDIHNRVQTNKISIYDAADLITNDASLKQLDSNYQGNAFLNIGNATKSDEVSRFPEIDTAAKNLKAGEISPIIKVVKNGQAATGVADIKFTADDKLDANEMFYAFVKASNQVNGKYEGLENWINQAKVKYPFKAQ